MIWQDWVFTVGQVIFILGLLPTLRSSEKPPLSTGILTGTTLLVFASCYATMSMWFSALAGTVLGLEWLIIAWQVWSRPALVKR